MNAADFGDCLCCSLDTQNRGQKLRFCVTLWMIPWYSIASHVSLEERRAREKEASLDFGVSWYKVGVQNTSYK